MKICKCHGKIEFKCPDYGKEPEETRSVLPDALEAFYSDAVLVGIITSLVTSLQNLDDERKTMVYTILDNFKDRLNDEVRSFQDKYKAVEEAFYSGKVSFRSEQPE